MDTVDRVPADIQNAKPVKDQRIDMIKYIDKPVSVAGLGWPGRRKPGSQHLIDIDQVLHVHCARGRYIECVQITGWRAGDHRCLR